VPEIVVLLAAIRVWSAGEVSLSFTGAARGGGAVLALPHAHKSTVIAIAERAVATDTRGRIPLTVAP
jgi:hypothetical protein